MFGHPEEFHASHAPISIFAALLVTAATHAASPAPVSAEHGMVVTAQQHATRIGVDVLRNGGNAIDAAVAVGYALAVVYPAAGNLGGGGFMTLQLADGRKTFIDFRETAPFAATATCTSTRRARGARLQHARLRRRCAGTSRVWNTRAKSTAPSRAATHRAAIRLAENGFVLEQGDVDILREGTADFLKDAPSAAIFLNREQPLEPGSRLVQKDLARTLRNVSQRGVAGFYQGETAAALLAASRAGGGILTQRDFDAFATRELPPLECDYRGLHIGPHRRPSGGIVLAKY
jgi:gamma-glutamyltranspeptidase/glutathione hydrolase